MLVFFIVPCIAYRIYSGYDPLFSSFVRFFALPVWLFFPAAEHFPTFASLQATYMKIA